MRTIRRLAGLLVAGLGVVVLFGGLFVPWDVILREPRMVPAPESWVAWWIIAVGLLLAVWPARASR
jgi:hydrogenase/urease accessory protein HupE